MISTSNFIRVTWAWTPRHSLEPNPTPSNDRPVSSQSKFRPRCSINLEARGNLFFSPLRDQYLSLVYPNLLQLLSATLPEPRLFASSASFSTQTRVHSAATDIPPRVATTTPNATLPAIAEHLPSLSTSFPTNGSALMSFRRILVSLFD